MWNILIYITFEIFIEIKHFQYKIYTYTCINILRTIEHDLKNKNAYSY